FLTLFDFSHFSSVFFQLFLNHCDLHSFPTRRSSDLAVVEAERSALHFGRILKAVREVQVGIAENYFVGEGRVDHLGQIQGSDQRDRKSTRLNSSHGSISYAVFCLKKKKIKKI